MWKLMNGNGNGPRLVGPADLDLEFAKPHPASREPKLQDPTSCTSTVNKENPESLAGLKMQCNRARMSSIGQLMVNAKIQVTCAVSSRSAWRLQGSAEQVTQRATTRPKLELMKATGAKQMLGSLSCDVT
jgi:hypothetical protein